jgi:glycosyltransferase involved in cell wall biosynthesis
MYGTERMALSTATGLVNEFETIFLGPEGPALIEARRLGFETRAFQSVPALMHRIWEVLWQFRSFTFVSTSPRYSAICMMLNYLLRRKVRDVQMIHGGGNDDKDYVNLWRFNAYDSEFVTVSEYSRENLIELGVRPERISVVGNFLTSQQLAVMPRRPAYLRDGVRSVAIVARIDPPKRVDLLLDALDRHAAPLRDISFRILGWGPDFDKLRQRARAHPNVQFAGYTQNVAAELAAADMMVHTCSVEAFGLAVLEAMAVGLPALVPDRGGTATLIANGETGFTFRADDPDHLAARLIELKDSPAELLNRISLAARNSHDARFSAEVSLEKYRRLFEPPPIRYDAHPRAA